MLLLGHKLLQTICRNMPIHNTLPSPIQEMSRAVGRRQLTVPCNNL
jgi:hypothetical protein